MVIKNIIQECPWKISRKILPFTKVKRNLLDILKNMEKEEETIALTKMVSPSG